GPPPSKRPPSEGEPSPRMLRYQQFYTRLRAALLKRDPQFTRAKGLPQCWWSLGTGRSGFSLAFSFTLDDKFRVELYIDTGNKEDNERAFGDLKERQAEIEASVGQALVWDPLPEKRACRIFIAAGASIDDSDERLAEVIEWAVPLALKFRETFTPLIKDLQLNE
ncbi:MAG: DUF4268 domain-containing protein, partial [candidate division WOR-3 bacterium]